MEVTQAMEALKGVLTRTDDRGRALWSPGHIEHLVPFMLFAGADAVRSADVAENVARYLGAFGVTLGLQPGFSPDALLGAAIAYYRELPVHPALLAEVTAALTEQGKDPAWGVGAQALLVALEQPWAAAWLPTLRTQKAPVRGGPLARATLNHDSTRSDIPKR